MSAESPNDGDGAQNGFNTHDPDAHGQAAMLLVESLIHGMIARSVITVADAIDIVDIAAEVKRDIGKDLGDSPATLRESIALLRMISASMTNDLMQD